MSFTVINPFTGTPLEKCPDGTPLKDETFETEAEAMKFLKEHGANPVQVVEVESKKR
ncbi:TPA: hypothetical protein ACXE9F_002237 [Pluralibacter gergoviae]